MRSLRQGEAMQALRALPAAMRLAAGTRPNRLSEATLGYLRRNDAGYRPALPGQLLAEFWGTRRLKALPPPPRAGLPAWRR